MDSITSDGHIINWADECGGLLDTVSVDMGSECEILDTNEGLLTWEWIGEPLAVVPLAVENLVDLVSPQVGVSGCKGNIDSNLLSQWVTKRIKAFRKFVGTSSEGLEEQVTGLFLALEAGKK